MTEDAFLASLRESPADIVTRRALSDWLEEQYDAVSTRKAEYIRADLELASTPRNPKRKGDRKRLTDRRRELAAQLDLDWMAVVTLAPIEVCTFAFKCPLRWENLNPVEGETTVRHCSSCSENVFFSGTLDDARRHARAGHCVAVDASVIRVADDLRQPQEEFARGMLLGKVAPRNREDR